MKLRNYLEMLGDVLSHWDFIFETFQTFEQKAVEIKNKFQNAFDRQLVVFGLADGLLTPKLFRAEEQTPTMLLRSNSKAE